MTGHRFTRVAITLMAGAMLALGYRADAKPCTNNPALSCDNPASTCDNLKQNDPANSCYVLTPPISATTITIDGQDTGGVEWTGVSGLLTKNPAGALSDGHTVQVRQESTIVAKQVVDNLVLFVTIVDGANSPDDFVQIVFDPLHDDHVPTANATDDDVMFTIFRGPDNGLHAPHAPRRITKAGDAEWIPTPGHGAFAVKSSASGWSVELRVDPLELLTSQLPSAVGFGVQLNDFDTGNTAVWPLDFVAPSVITSTPFDNLAVLKSRLPIDYVLSLDYSGSMVATDGLPENRWKRATRAADMFVAVAALFGDPGYFDDRVGASRYAWNCSVDAPSGDRTEPFPVGSGSGSGGPGSKPQCGDIIASNLAGFPDGDLFGPNAAPDPPGDNCTPISCGLHHALEQFSLLSQQAPLRERFVILLSDGFHNTPSADAGFNNAPAGSFTAEELASCKVRTVAMGNDGSAGTKLLADIASAFNSGGAPEAKYNQLAPAQNLLEAYLETLQQPLHVNRIGDDDLASSTGSFSPGTVDRLVFIGAWNTPANAKPLTIERDGVAVPGTRTIGPDTTIGFSAVVIDHPQPGGVWKFTGSTPDVRYVLADLRVYAEFFTEPRIYNTGDPILLQVRLRDAGKPVLGAEVTVETAIPGQGLGNFLATTDAECQVGPPTFPNLTQGTPIVAAKLTSGAPTSPTATAAPAKAVSTSAAATGTPDPRPGRYALAQQLFDRCKKSDDKTNLPGTKLFDDATHGDLVAGDGVYSLAFPTTLEGSYNFRFHVRGTESTGARFSRTSLLSQYVQVAPTPAATQTTVQVGPVVNGLQTAFVLFIPRDGLGNYVGPGFTTNYHVTVPGGTTLGGVTDLGRGVYSQQIGYSVNTPTPPVVIASDDPPVKIVLGGPGGGKRGISTWFTEHCCLVLVVLVVLLIIVIAIRRRRP